MVGALALAIDKEGASKIAKLSCLSVHPKHQRKGVGSLLLCKAEATCRALGCSKARLDFEVARDDFAPWLHRRGYQACGGGTWECGEVFVPFVSYAKDLNNPHQNPTPTEPPLRLPDKGLLDLLDITSALADSMPVVDVKGSDSPLEFNGGGPVGLGGLGGGLGGGECGSGNRQGVGLEDLLGVLMSQLGTTEGRAEFTALVEADEPNVLGKPILPTIPS